TVEDERAPDPLGSTRVGRVWTRLDEFPVGNKPSVAAQIAQPNVVGHRFEHTILDVEQLHTLCILVHHEATIVRDARVIVETATVAGARWNRGSRRSRASVVDDQIRDALLPVMLDEEW